MTPELAKALREAGLWEAVLLDNANTGSKWREAVNAAYEDAAKIAEGGRNLDAGPVGICEDIAAAIREKAKGERE
jgi:ABC-type sugar transport system substrate-binding protein